jgi:hypothetical protein
VEPESASVYPNADEVICSGLSLFRIISEEIVAALAGGRLA